VNIHLIGYRGTGKSTVAPLVAAALGPDWTWLDLDVELERSAGRTIAAIFAESGETAFRDLEEEVLAQAVRRDQRVLATGGGVIGRESNRLRLAKGWNVWLTAAPETIHARINGDTVTAGRRPNLTVGGLKEIEELLAKREPLYREFADLVLPTDHASAAALAARIVKEFQAYPRRDTATGASG
jgi:shikimate kinase